MTGTIAAIEDCGSVVLIWLGLDAGGTAPVHMDHRTFGWLVQGEGMEPVGDLIGRAVEFDGETIVYQDTLEIA